MDNEEKLHPCQRLNQDVLRGIAAVQNTEEIVKVKRNGFSVVYEQANLDPINPMENTSLEAHRGPEQLVATPSELQEESALILEQWRSGCCPLSPAP